MTTKEIAIYHLNVTQDLTSQVQKSLHEALESFDLSPVASDPPLAILDIYPAVLIFLPSLLLKVIHHIFELWTSCTEL
jgi:hypothetical protein